MTAPYLFLNNTPPQSSSTYSVVTEPGLNSSTYATVPNGSGSTYSVVNSISAFSPLTLSPVAWFRSDLGITTVSGNVSSWADQSGNNHTVSQATGANRPAYSATGGVNSRPKLTWGNINQQLQNTSFTSNLHPIEYFIVATASSLANFPGHIIDLGTNNDVSLQDTGGPMAMYNGTLQPVYGSAPTINTAFVIDCYFSFTASDTIIMNGVNPVSAASGSTTQTGTNLTIGGYGGGGQGWMGDIYEVIIYAAQLSTTQRNQVLNYISSLYGIAI